MGIEFIDGKCTVSREIPEELRKDVDVSAKLLGEWDSSGCKIICETHPPFGVYQYSFECEGVIPTKEEIAQAEEILDKALHWMWEISKVLRMVRMILPALIKELQGDVEAMVQLGKDLLQLGNELLNRVEALESRESPPTWSNFAEHTLELNRLRQEVSSLKQEVNAFRQAYYKYPTPDEKYNLPVEKFGLSVRTSNCLRRTGIKTVGELLTKREEDLMSLKNFGQKSLQEVAERLSAFGLSLDRAAQQGDTTE